MMSTAANAKSFAELLNSYNQQQQIQQQQQQIQAQKALLEAHNENSQSSEAGRGALWTGCLLFAQKSLEIIKRQFSSRFSSLTREKAYLF